MAPHPDDEVLAAGGLIYTALQRGAQVKTVFMTLGDGYPAAAGLLSSTSNPTAASLLALGNHRREEAIAALAILGVHESDIIFLGYPDGGLAEMLDYGHWWPEEAYKSGYTAQSSIPYSHARVPGAAYCASVIVNDLAGILMDYMPDLVIIPHANDAHGDHWATSALAMNAMAQLDYVELTGARVLCYMIHAGVNWPDPWSYRPDLRLDPPAGRSAPRSMWVRVDLTTEAVDMKHRALKQYRSQLALMPSFLKSFIRTNELFSTVPELGVELSAQSAQLHQWNAAEPGPILQYNRKFWPSGEITSVTVNPIDGGIVVNATLAGRPKSSVQYELKAACCSSVSRTGSICEPMTYGPEPLAASGPDKPREVAFLLTSEQLDSLGPRALLEVVTTRRGKLLDRSGWFLVHLTMMHDTFEAGTSI